MVRFMAQTSTTNELAKNVLYTLHVAKITRKDLATQLRISPSTVTRRLRDGEFTVGQLVVIATLAGVPVEQLIPNKAAA
jgi:transcriptional regulator with XRE-family HTH domain